jgi:hypothetical protein
MKITPLSGDLVLKLTLIAAAVAALAFIVKKVSSAASTAISEGAAAVDGAVANAVIGAGGVVGIPATNDDQCSLDIARGDMWAASFSCTASRFIDAVKNPPANVGVTGNW